MTNKQPVHFGQAVYSTNVLKVYDFAVLNISNSYIWKCPTTKLLEKYNRYLSNNHLDVGVGTGFFLDQCHFDSASPRVALMDLNPNSLQFASNRIARYKPLTFQQNILEPIHLDTEKFDSIGINFLLHCLPGSMHTKSVVFKHLKTLLNPNGVLFGSTLLQGGVKRNLIAKGLMSVYNKTGIFSNQQDSLDGLTEALKQYFTDFSVEVVGCTALFVARV